MIFIFIGMGAAVALLVWLAIGVRVLPPHEVGWVEYFGRPKQPKYGGLIVVLPGGVLRRTDVRPQSVTLNIAGRHMELAFQVLDAQDAFYNLGNRANIEKWMVNWLEAELTRQPTQSATTLERNMAKDLAQKSVKLLNPTPPS